MGFGVTDIYSKLADLISTTLFSLCYAHNQSVLYSLPIFGFLSFGLYTLAHSSHLFLTLTYLCQTDMCFLLLSSWWSVNNMEILLEHCSVSHTAVISVGGIMGKLDVKMRIQGNKEEQYAASLMKHEDRGASEAVHLQ